MNCCTCICCLVAPLEKKGKQKNTCLTVQLIAIDLPAVGQRNLEGLELIFPRVHTPLWAQCTCPGPPRASRRWARRSCGRGAGEGLQQPKLHTELIRSSLKSFSDQTILLPQDSDKNASLSMISDQTVLFPRDSDKNASLSTIVNP